MWTHQNVHIWNICFIVFLPTHPMVINVFFLPEKNERKHTRLLYIFHVFFFIDWGLSIYYLTNFLRFFYTSPYLQDFLYESSNMFVWVVIFPSGRLLTQQGTDTPNPITSQCYCSPKPQLNCKFNGSPKLALQIRIHCEIVNNCIKWIWLSEF